MVSASRTSVDFIVDNSLGKLLKWLRLLGFNAVSEHDYLSGMAGAADHKFQDTPLLTRSGSTRSQKRETIVMIKADQVAEQLAEVINACRIRPEDLHPFSRCILCNVPIEGIEKMRIRGRVPDYVWETHDIFSCCPACQRIYWRGTHAQKINNIVQRLFDQTRYGSLSGK